MLLELHFLLYLHILWWYKSLDNVFKYGTCTLKWTCTYSCIPYFKNVNLGILCKIIVWLTWIAEILQCCSPPLQEKGTDTKTCLPGEVERDWQQTRSQSLFTVKREGAPTSRVREATGYDESGSTQSTLINPDLQIKCIMHCMYMYQCKKKQDMDTSYADLIHQMAIS